ncbi:MAG TPA: isoprenylcysteine carboxylmethyltransferase family protein [Ramlibacter sp.]
MRKLLSALYGLTAYACFFGTFLYAIAFVGNCPMVRGIDAGPSVPLSEALAVDLVLLTIFALQHSVMARPAFKRRWTRIVPPALERSTYVLMASVALALLLWQWRPVAAPVWSFAGTGAGVLLQVLFWTGWGVLLVSTFLINHFELFGLRQSFAPLLGLREPAPEFRTPFFYRYVRHPIYLGFLLAFWSAREMSAGHLLFSVMTTGYILVGIFFEERDLVAQFGTRYTEYRRRVGMLLPRLRPAAPTTTGKQRSA